MHTARDAGARHEADLPGLSGRFRACAISLRMVPVLLNLVQKLPVPTDCRYCVLGTSLEVFILGENLHFEKKRNGKSLGAIYQRTL